MHFQFRPVRGDKIKPQPVMELEVKKSNIDTEYNPDSGVRCLYEARKNLGTQASDEALFKNKLQEINPKFALSQIREFKIEQCGRRQTRPEVRITT